MEKICFLLLSAELFIGSYAFATTPDIKLSGRKDHVLSSEMRTTVLDVAEIYLNQEDQQFLALMAEVKNPYVFKEMVAVEAQEPEVVAAPVYDDLSILKAIGGSFATQVRGTLARGTTHYLQLQGGGMVQSGTSFPAKIPEVEGQSFNVTITDVNSVGYTLKMGDAILPMTFDVSAGATKDSTQ